MTSKKRKVSLTVENQPGQILPCVCYFPSGLNPTDQSEDNNSLSIEVKSKKSKNATNYKVVANKGNINFTGDSADRRSDGDATRTACSYAVAVYDKESGKVTFAPIAGGRVFRLEPRIRDLAYEPTGNGGSGSNSEALTNKVANVRLVDEFGSTRRRRQLSAREEGIVRAEKMSGRDAVEQMLADVATRAAGEGLTKSEVLQRSALARQVPPHNPDATSALEAYPLRLLLPALASGLHGEAFILGTKRLTQAAESEEVAKSMRVHPYVLKRLPQLRHGDAVAVTRRAKYLGLLAALLQIEPRKFLKVHPVTVATAAAAPAAEEESPAEGGEAASAVPALPSGGMEGLARQLKIRAELLEDLLELFYERVKRNDDEAADGVVHYERPEAKKNLLLLYILTCALVADDGVMGYEQFEDLKLALKLSPSNLVMYFTELGAVSKAKSVKLDPDSELSIAAGGVTRLNSYTVSLLHDPNRPDKTLRDCFPVMKISKKAAGRR